MVMGASRNFSVERTVCDGPTRQYFCVMLEDVTIVVMPAFVHEMTSSMSIDS